LPLIQSLIPFGISAARKCALRRFPFSIFYRASTNEILVLAVAHAKRHPDYWHARAFER